MAAIKRSRSRELSVQSRRSSVQKFICLLNRYYSFSDDDTGKSCDGDDGDAGLRVDGSSYV